MYAAGDRRNDVYGCMRAIAAKLTEAESMDWRYIIAPVADSSALPYHLDVSSN
jgi:hypothetical protein